VILIIKSQQVAITLCHMVTCPDQLQSLHLSCEYETTFTFNSYEAPLLQLVLIRLARTLLVADIQGDSEINIQTQISQYPRNAWKFLH